MDKIKKITENTKKFVDDWKGLTISKIIFLVSPKKLIEKFEKFQDQTFVLIFVAIFYYYIGAALLYHPSVDFSKSWGELIQNNYVRASIGFFSLVGLVFFKTLLVSFSNKKAKKEKAEKGSELLENLGILLGFKVVNVLLLIFWWIFTISAIVGSFWAITAGQQGGFLAANGTLCQILNEKLVIKKVEDEKAQAEKKIKELSRELKNDHRKLLQFFHVVRDDNDIPSELKTIFNNFLTKINKDIGSESSLIYLTTQEELNEKNIRELVKILSINWDKVRKAINNFQKEVSEYYRKSLVQKRITDYYKKKETDEKSVNSLAIEEVSETRRRASYHSVDMDNVKEQHALMLNNLRYNR